METITIKLTPEVELFAAHYEKGDMIACPTPCAAALQIKEAIQQHKKPKLPEKLKRYDGDIRLRQDYEVRGTINQIIDYLTLNQ